MADQTDGTTQTPPTASEATGGLGAPATPETPAPRGPGDQPPGAPPPSPPPEAPPPPPPPPGQTSAPDFIAPAFEYEGGKLGDDFNLQPRRTYKGVIPEDQRRIAFDVYEARNVLKLLKERGAIEDQLFKEFITRVNQAGLAGCASNDSVHPSLGAAALEQIRADIVRRAGTPLVYRY